jgi:hypothetical protein
MVPELACNKSCPGQSQGMDGGQLVNADQLLARLCSIPTNDVAMASIVLLREIAHGVAPVLQRPSIEILDHFREWIAGRDSS